MMLTGQARKVQFGSLKVTRENFNIPAKIVRLHASNPLAADVHIALPDSNYFAARVLNSTIDSAGPEDIHFATPAANGTGLLQKFDAASEARGGFVSKRICCFHSTPEEQYDW